MECWYSDVYGGARVWISKNVIVNSHDVMMTKSSHFHYSNAPLLQISMGWL